MKYIKNTFLFLAIILISSSCKKLDDPMTQQIIGTWEFQHVTNLDNPFNKYENTQYDKNYAIRFYENGKFEIIDNGNTDKHFITNIEESNSFVTLENIWQRYFSFKKDGEKTRLDLVYFNDTVFIQDYPNYLTDRNTNGANPPNLNNLFTRVQ
jgi:hypothetical protein